MQRRTTREQRIRIVARFRKSGLTQREFAEREDITVSALQNWLTMIRKSGHSLS